MEKVSTLLTERLQVKRVKAVVIITSMFMTAGAANPLLMELAKKTANISVD